ncbi:helix-turn-helix domain-containing protein [Actinomadura sp. NTSP31]|uniref:helix-turn-helix domain-containing protein n=1 Tax=Actinomadura sp. NTSP31 TaxID=1735447 RepID=UPI0035BF7607
MVDLPLPATPITTMTVGAPDRSPCVPLRPSSITSKSSEARQRHSQRRPTPAPQTPAWTLQGQSTAMTVASGTMRRSQVPGSYPRPSSANGPPSGPHANRDLRSGSARVRSAGIRYPQDRGRGVDRVAVQQMLGHWTVGTTIRYARPRPRPRSLRSCQSRSWERSPSMPSGLVTRARIVLLTAEGVSNAEIARRLQGSGQTVVTWRNRFRSAWPAVWTTGRGQGVRLWWMRPRRWFARWRFRRSGRGSRAAGGISLTNGPRSALARSTAAHGLSQEPHPAGRWPSPACRPGVTGRE